MSNMPSTAGFRLTAIALMLSLSEQSHAGLWSDAVTMAQRLAEAARQEAALLLQQTTEEIRRRLEAETVAERERQYCNSVTSAMDTYTVGAWKVDVNRGDGSWAVRKLGTQTPVMSSTVCVGSTFNAPVKTSYGQHPHQFNLLGQWFDMPGAMDQTLKWSAALPKTPTISQQNGILTIKWKMGNNSPDSTVSFKQYDQTNLHIGVDQGSTLLATDKNAMLRYSSALRMDCQANESFFGLGAQSAGMDLRGRHYPLWAQEPGIRKFDNPLAHKPWPLGALGQLFPYSGSVENASAPMGVWHSTRGYSAVIGHDSYTDVDVCTNPSNFTVRSHSTPTSFVLMSGNTMKERLSEVTKYVGRLKKMPADWVFGPWNDAPNGQEWLEYVVKQLRDKSIPSSAIWSEDWAGGKENLTHLALPFGWIPSERRYPSLPTTTQSMHENGFAFLVYFNTFVPKNERVWNEGNPKGYLVKNEMNETLTVTDGYVRQSGLVDFSNPGAFDWMKNAKIAAVKVGIDGWMADFSEYLPPHAKLASGESGWHAHNKYPLEYFKLNSKALSEIENGNGKQSYFTRSGWASINGGSPGIAPILWAGDQTTNWEKYDGIPAALSIGLQAGMSGSSLVTHDIGGYTSAPVAIPFLSPYTTKELFFRWSALGAFNPIMRTHHGLTSCSNWNFLGDDETTTHWKRYASIHTLLFPYFKGLTQESMDSGWPVVRHPVLVDEANSDLWKKNDQYVYFVGDNMLVAPVLARGTTARNVHFGKGYWWPLFGNKPMDTVASSPFKAEATQSEIPVFIRGGSIIPMLPKVVDSFYGITSVSGQKTFYGNASTSGTDLADVAGKTALALYPGKNGELQKLTVGDASIEGAGWYAGSDRSHSVVWSYATWNDVVLPSCSTTTQQSCYSAEGVELRNVTSGVLRVGNAQLRVNNPAQQSWNIRLAANAWGTLANAGTFTDSMRRTDPCKEKSPQKTPTLVQPTFPDGSY